MSFPNVTGPQGGPGPWMGYHQQYGHPTPPPQAPSQPENSAVQTRPMGLKVQYAFDKDQQNCLARWPHTLQIQTIPIDERNAIGIVDLRICLEAIAQCSPEIINQHDKDYAVYAVDYSEEDVPLVGQGMLSWGLAQPAPSSEQKLVTGRVVKNMMAVFGAGVPETLEVKFKLNTVSKMHQRPQTSYRPEPQRAYSNAPSPAPMDGNSEWSSFVQSNPNFARPATGPSMPSPNLAPARYGSPVQAYSPAPELHSFPPVAPTPPPTIQPPMQPVPLPPVSQPPVFQGPAGEDMSSLPRLDEGVPPAPPTKPAKRTTKAPKKKRSGTGNPVGRPPKHARPDSGNTSALEDVTDADEAPAEAATTEGPKKKRAKTTKADWPDKGPLSSAPGSLRVAASTSGSLRTMRPAASGGNGVGASHLQEVPRAPTPVPGQSGPRVRGRLLAPGQPRRLSMADSDGHMRAPVSETGMLGPHTQDARSPSEMAAHSPYQAYTPDESTGDIGSSPPVPRSTHSVRSSPPPSSPVLPPMPMPPPDSGFMSGGFDDMVDEEHAAQATAPPQPVAAVRSKPGPKSKGKGKKGQAAKLKTQKAPTSNGAARPASSGVSEPVRPMSQGLPEPPAPLPPPMALGLPEPPSSAAPPKPFPQGLPGPPPGTEAALAPSVPARAPKGMVIEQVYPGPPELLPKTSLYNPPVTTKNQLRGNGTKAATRQLKRSNTEPTVQRQEAPQPAMYSTPIPEIQPCTTEISPPEVRPPQPVEEPADQSRNEPVGAPMADAPLPSIDEPQVPTPATMGPYEGTIDGPDEQLLRLLSEPAEFTGNGNCQLPPNSSFNMSHVSAQQPLNSQCTGPPGTAQIPASDPGVFAPAISPPALPSDASQPSKNFSRKQSIKEKLEQAVQMGQMPTFCSNCGAISTPTWRRIWTQDRDGSPEFPVYSDKPGCITAIVITKRDENEKPTRYKVIKKALGPTEDKSKWTEDILCNPCGIWLSKFKSQRPEERWEKEIKPRPGKSKGSRKSRSGQKTATANLTSEAYFTTDPIGPDDQGPSPPKDGDEVMLLRATTTEPPSRERGSRSQTAGAGDSFGTLQSPAAMEEEDLGKTRRLLFPSPKKDGQPKVLGEVAVNIVQTSPSTARFRNADASKENRPLDLDLELNLLSTPKMGDDDDMVDLFGTPPRPSTPPPKEQGSVPFKTPTRPTPSHRPITRSVSRSIRTVRTGIKSPGHALHQLQQTPTKTPRSSARLRSGNSGGNTHYSHAHFEQSITGGPTIEFCSPFSSTLNQLLSEANEFTAGSSAHGLSELDLPNMGSDLGLSGHLESLDFGHFLTTDAAMPSSPPMMGGNGDDSFADASLNFDGWDSLGTLDMDDGGAINEGDASTSAK